MVDVRTLVPIASLLHAEVRGFLEAVNLVCDLTLRVEVGTSARDADYYAAAIADALHLETTYDGATNVICSSSIADRLTGGLVSAFSGGACHTERSTAGTDFASAVNFAVTWAHTSVRDRVGRRSLQRENCGITSRDRL